MKTKFLISMHQLGPRAANTEMNQDLGLGL